MISLVIQYFSKKDDFTVYYTNKQSVPADCVLSFRVEVIEEKDTKVVPSKCIQK